jgi:hypothetical protein
MKVPITVAICRPTSKFINMEFKKKLWARIVLYTGNRKDMFTILNTTLGCGVHFLQIKIRVLKTVKNLKLCEILGFIDESCFLRCCAEYQ